MPSFNPPPSKTEEGRLRLEKQDHWALLTIDHPRKANALDRSILNHFHRHLDTIDADPTIRALILTGSGRHFSSGAPLDYLTQKESQQTVAEILDVEFHPVLRRLYDLDIPLITAVNGPAVGIGYSFALMGDVVLMNVSSYLYPSFSAIGLAPDGGATAMTLRRVGYAHAFEILALPKKIDSALAVEKGLATRLCADETLMDETITLAKTLAQQPQSALKHIKKTLQTGYQDSYQQQIERERISQKDLAKTHDLQEGIQAFLEKRSPHFNAS